jgi:hypothetical protein
LSVGTAQIRKQIKGQTGRVMWNWLQDNAQILSALSAWATLGVWALYLQLLYSSYRLSRRAKILINRGAGDTIDAKCIIANMGAEPIYIEAIRISLTRGDCSHSCALSNHEVSMTSENDPRPQLMQGPLSSSEMLDIGRFSALIGYCINGASGFTGPDSEPLIDNAEVTILVVATMASESRPVAAQRTFKLGAQQDPLLLHPRTLRTEQIRSKRARREIEASLNRDLESEWRSKQPDAGGNSASPIN